MTAMEVLTAKDILSRAADLLEARGVAKDHYYDPVTGAFCAVGALIAVANGAVGALIAVANGAEDVCGEFELLSRFSLLPGERRWVYDQALRLVGDQMGQSVQRSGPGVVMDWSDRSEPAAVIAAFRAAAEAAL